MPKDFLHITDLTADEIHSIFELAEVTKKRFSRREKYAPLRGHTLAMIFAKPSARTRISFETGFHRLGGHALYLGPNDIGIGKREAVKDIAQVVSRYNDIIMARLFEHRHMLELAENATVPVVNGLTDYNHPCQIIADMFTIREHRGNLDDLHITYVGDGNNIVHDLAGVVVVAQADDHRHRGVFGQFQHMAVIEQPGHDNVIVAAHHLGDVLDRLALADADIVGSQVQGVAAQAVEAGLERNARPGGRLGEDHRQGMAPQGNVFLPAAEPFFGQLGQLEDRVNFVVGQIGYVKTVFGHLMLLILIWN